MSDNMLRILVQTTLDTQNSTTTINNQLKQISNKLNDVKVNVNIDQIKKAAQEYELWWSRALEKEEKLREKNLQYEQRTRDSLNKKLEKEREQALQYEQKVNAQIEKNNQKQLDAEDRIQQKKLTNLQNFLEKSEYIANRLSTKYGSNVDSNQISNLLNRSRNLNIADPNLTNNMRQISDGFKDIESSAKKAGMSISSQFGEAMSKFPIWIAVSTLWMGTIHTIMSGFKDGIIDIESKMAGYIQTNEHYFTTIKNGVESLDTAKVNEQTKEFIITAHSLGASINEVLESARLWGRMYKDVNVVQELVRQSTKLSTVDLVSLDDATKMMEATLAQYGVQLKNVNEAQVIGNRILDSWSKVAHETMAPARDLGAAFERTGKIASETGVSFDFMNGLISAGVRNTALSGQNLGNMWKTVLGTIRTDKAVKEIENLGVETKKVVNGVEEWRRAEDILLDLSVKVIDKNYDLTKSYQDISRGVYQFAKLAASLNAGDILLGTAASINSTGSTMNYLKVQMDTIQRKAEQTKTSLFEIFNNAGNDGLRSLIKDSLDFIDQLLIGLTKVPKELYQTIGLLGSLLIIYKAFQTPVANLITAIGVLTTSKTAETMAISANTVANEVNIVSSNGMVLATTKRAVATESATLATNAMTVATESATIAMSTGAAVMTVVTGGLALLGVILAGVVYYFGAVEKAQRDKLQADKDQMSANQQLMGQYDRQIELLPKLVSAHNDLQKVYDGLSEAAKTDTETARKQLEVKGQLEKISQALTMTIKNEGLAQLQAAGYTADAVKIQIDKIKEARNELNKTNLIVLNKEKNDLNQKVSNKENELKQKDKELEGATNKKEKYGTYGYSPILQQKIIDQKRKEREALQAEKEKLDRDLAQKNSDITNLTTQPIVDELNGASEKEKRKKEDIEKSFDNDMSTFRHLVNRRTEGYIDASEQLDKLNAIKEQYKDKLIGTEAFENLLDEISRAEDGIALKAKGYGSGTTTPSPYDNTQKYKIDEYKQSLQVLDGQLKESEAIMTRYKDTSKDYRTELQSQVDIIKEKQRLTAQEGIRLRSDTEDLEKKVASTSDQKKQNEYLQQLDQAKNNLASLSNSWWDYEVNIEQSQKKLKESLFNFSKEWITNEKSSMELLGSSEVEVAQMVYDAWKRVADKREEYNAEQQDEINKNLIQANNELKKASMTQSEKWIQEETDRMTLAGKSEIEIAQMVLDARKRLADERWTKERDVTALTTSEQLKADKAVFDARQKLLNLQESNQKKISDNLKTIIKQISDAQKDYYDGLLKAEDERHKKVNENLDAEMKKTQDAVDLIKKSINRESATDDYSTNLTKVQKEAQDIQNQINLYQRDNSIEGKAKLVELEKQYADKQDEIQKLQKDRTKQLREDNLDDILEIKKKETDAAKKSEDAQYEATKKSLDNQKIAAENYWNDIVNNDAKFTKLQNDIISGHFENIKNEMEGFKTNISNISSVIGQAVSQGITDKITQAQQALTNFSKNPSGDSSNFFKSNSKLTNGTSTSYYAPTSNEEQAIAKMKENSNAWSTANDTRKQELESANQTIGYTIGATYSNGTWYKNGLPLYHEGGEIGTNSSAGGWLHKLLNLGQGEIPLIGKQGELVLKNPASAISNLLSSIKMPDFSNIIPKNANTGNGTSIGDIHMNITVNGNESGGETVFNTFVKRLQKLGV